MMARPFASSPPLPIVHCSAGIGRTGCMIAILNGLRQMRSNAAAAAAAAASGGTGSSSGPAHCVDVLGIVCNLRLQRGGMVQNSEQYELIHRALCLYAQRQQERTSDADDADGDGDDDNGAKEAANRDQEDADDAEADDDNDDAEDDDDDDEADANVGEDCLDDRDR